MSVKKDPVRIFNRKCCNHLRVVGGLPTPIEPKYTAFLKFSTGESIFPAWALRALARLWCLVSDKLTSRFCSTAGLAEMTKAKRRATNENAATMIKMRIPRIGDSHVSFITRVPQVMSPIYKIGSLIDWVGTATRHILVYSNSLQGTRDIRVPLFFGCHSSLAIKLRNLFGCRRRELREWW